jgi:hypothetical protein
MIAERDAAVVRRDEAIVQRESIRAERAAMMAEGARLLGERDEGLTRLAQVSVEHDIYRRNCEAAHASTCWRLNAPLRSVSSLLLSALNRFGGAQETN